MLLFRELTPLRKVTGELSLQTRRIVLAADLGKCVFCGWSYGSLQVDHLIPQACGGQDEWRNLTTLCKTHNLIKSSYYVAPDGYVSYKPWPLYDDIKMAAAILAREQWAMRNPLRWYRLWAAMRGEAA